MNFRTMPSGDKFAPNRGKPPKAPEGYCQDSKNLFLYHPILDACDYRTPFREELSCGKLDIGTFCDRDERIVTGADCLVCVPAPVEVEDAKEIGT